MALRRDPYEALALDYLNRGEPAAPPRPVAAQPVDTGPTPEEIEQARRERALASTSETERALNQGVAGIQSSLYAGRGLARIGAAQLGLGTEQGGVDDILRSQEIEAQAAAEGPRVQNLDQIEGVGDALEYGRNLLVGQAPNIALTLGTGGIGGVARTAGGLAVRAGARSLAARAAAREAAELAGENIVSRAAVRDARRRLAREAAPSAFAPAFEQGARVGAAAGGTLLQAGQTADVVTDPEGTGTVGERAAKAATGAVLTGAVEALPVMALFRRYGLGQAEEVARQTVSGPLVARLLKQGAKQGLAESATEVAQTLGEVATHKWVNDNVDLMGDDALNQYVNAAVGGALGGAAFGAPAGFRGVNNNRLRERATNGLRQGWDKLAEKLQRAQPGEQVGPAQPRTPRQPQQVGEPTGADGIAARVAQKADQLRQTFEQDIRPKVESGASEIQKQFNELLARFKKDDESNLLLDEFTAAPFDFAGVNGEAVVSGTPMASFANRDQLAAAKEAGLTGMAAQLTAALPDIDTALNLQNTGGLDAAVRAFRGDDVGKFSNNELNGLRAFMTSLAPDKQNQFRRWLSTQEALRDGGYIQTDEGGTVTGAQITAAAKNAPAQARGVGDVQAARALDAQSDTGKALLKAARGRQVADIPADAFATLPDEQGRRRQINVAGALKALDNDSDFQELTKNMGPGRRMEAKLAQVLGTLQQAGLQVDPASIRSIVLDPKTGQRLPQQVVNRVLAGMGDTTARGALAAQATPVEPVRRAIDDPQGQADRSDMVEEVGAAERNVGSTRLAPVRVGQGSPSGAANARGDALDTRYDVGDIDTAAQREENQPTNTPVQRRQRLDDLLTAAGGTRPKNWRERRRFIEEQRRKLTGGALRQLNENVYAASQGEVEMAERAVTKATREWQELRNRARTLPGGQQQAMASEVNAARDAVRKARERADKARAALNREGRHAARSRRQRATAESPADGTRAPAAEPSVRSRRALFQRAMEVINSRASEAAKLEQLTLIENDLQALGTTISNSAVAQGAEGRNAFDTPAKTTDAIRAKLADVTTTDAALRAVREFATPAQRRMIDTIIQMDGAKNTSFVMSYEAALHPKKLAGTYQSSRAGTLDGKIILRVPLQASDPNGTYDAVQVLIHEAAHAMTTYAEQHNPAVQKAFQRLLDHARKEAKKLGQDPDTWYGLSETQEFIAEAFSNPDFQSMLKDMPAANTDLFKNLWEQFKDFVAKLLGFKGEEATLFDEAITIGLEAARLKQVARVQELTRIFRGEDFNSVEAQAGSPRSYLLILPPEARAKLIAAFAPPALGRVDKKSAFNRIRELAPKELKPLLDTADQGPRLALDLGIAYALSGKLDLKTERTPVGQLWDAISSALKVPSANVYAQQIIQDLKDRAVGSGYDVVSRTLVRSESAAAREVEKQAVRATKFINQKVAPVYQALLKNIDTRIREQGIPAFTEMATLLNQRTGEFRSDSDRSFRSRVQAEQGKWLERLGKAIQGLSPQDERVLVRAMQSQRALPDKHKALQPVLDALRKWLDDFHDYSSEAGVKFGKLDNYFPVAMSADEVARRREQFFELHRAPNLEKPIRDRFEKWVRDEIKNIKPNADGELSARDAKRVERLEGRIDQLRKAPIDDLIGQLYDMAIFGGREHYIAGVNYTDEAHRPSFSNMKPRTSDFIFTDGTPEQKAAFSKFQDTNLSRILVTYANRGVRRAEWERMNLNDKLSQLKIDAIAQGANNAQMRMFDDYVNQIMGTYNDNWNPLVARALSAIDRVFDTDLANTDFQKFKAVQGAIMTYNNVRLLPLALASSLVDPLASMVRSGGVAGSFDNLRDAIRAFRNTEGGDALRAMAEDMGVIERQGIQEAMSYMYGNVYDPNSRAAKVNNVLFRFNGLEAMTRFSRLMALQAAHRFLVRHAKGEGDSARYLRELGLEPSDIKVSENGRFVELNEKTETALRRFVEEAVVRPHAAQRPSWHNDPNFALAAQYKGYLYAFYETVLKRVGVELQNGNPAVLAPLVLYLPMTAMAELGRDMAQGDDEDKDAEYYMKKSLERSGLLGARHGVVSDATDNIRYGNGVLGNIAGPTGQQLGDAYDVLNGTAEAGSVAVEALPGQALYKNWGD